MVFQTMFNRKTVKPVIYRDLEKQANGTSNKQMEHLASEPSKFSDFDLDQETTFTLLQEKKEIGNLIYLLFP